MNDFSGEEIIGVYVPAGKHLVGAREEIDSPLMMIMAGIEAEIILGAFRE